jgi:hypothetical protein
MTTPENSNDQVQSVLSDGVWTAIGSSMLPFVLPRSRLHLRLTDNTQPRLERGDLVCYLGTGDKIVAHRVVAVRDDGDQLEYIVKGDAQAWTERVSAEAIVAAVERVDQPFFSYRTDGAVGRAVAFMAVTTPSLTAATAAVTRVTINVVRKLIGAR